MYLLFLVLTLSPVQAESWSAGTKKFELIQDAKEDWISENCKIKCSLETSATEYLKNHSISSQLEGGKHPGSVLCKAVKGVVVYLEREGESDAFCKRSQEIISLARLYRLIN